MADVFVTGADLGRRLIVARALAAEHGIPLGWYSEEDQLAFDAQAVLLLRELDAQGPVAELVRVLRSMAPYAAVAAADSMVNSLGKTAQAALDALEADA